ARSPFLISPDKTIAYAWPNVKTKGHAEAVYKKIQELPAI
ncbi:peroxiredoxin, partial [Dolichospermum sp. ST_sed4]|nr:peroxiredoxin [Dolichospermum sp. ST_sed4]